MADQCIWPPETKPEVLDAIKEFLQGRTTPDIAAQRFTSSTAALYRAGNEIEGELWMLWGAINNVARESSSESEDQDKLVELVAAIKQLPILMRGSEECKVWDGTVWSELPIFGANMREDWNWFDPPSSNPNRMEIRRKWENLNAFAARLTATRTVSFDLYPIWAFKEALEDEPWNRPPTNESENSSNGSSDSSHNGGSADHRPFSIPIELLQQRQLELEERQLIYALDGYIPAAGQWIFHAGHLIFNNEREWVPSFETGTPAGGGDLWNGKMGFCKERWEFWKSRFTWVAEHPELLSETKVIARRAAQAMDNIEKDPKTDHWRARLAR